MSSGETVLLTAINVTSSILRPARMAAAFIRLRTVATFSATGMVRTINHEGHEVTRRKLRNVFRAADFGLKVLPGGRGRGRPRHTRAITSWLLEEPVLSGRRHSIMGAGSSERPEQSSRQFRQRTMDC